MKEFWHDHGTRLFFGLLSLLLALFLHYVLDMKEQASVIFVGLAMLCFNKARGNNKPEKPLTTP